MKTLLTTLCSFVILSTAAWGQGQDIKKSDGLPAAAWLLKNKYNLEIARIDYGNQELVSDFYDYKKSGKKYHGLWRINLNEGTEVIKLVDVQWFRSSSRRWQNVHPSEYSSKEKKLENHFAYQLEDLLSDTSLMDQARTWFFTGAEINHVFYNSATEISGQHWFENFLSGQNIKWPLKLDKVEKSPDGNFLLTYHYQRPSRENVMTVEHPYLYVQQETSNSDAAFYAKYSAMEVEGICESMTIKNGKFYLKLKPTL